MRILAYFIAFVSGTAVMMLQLIGTRVIGVFYGTGLFVWTALISLTLLALLIGYYVGGGLADRHPRGERLGYLLAITALFVFFTPLIATPVLNATDKLGIRLGLLASSALLFGPSLLLLGTVLPQVIRIRTDALERVGRSSGSVYAVSSAGSIAGTIVTGFVFLPLVSTTMILLGIGCTLGILGGVAVMALGGGKWGSRTIVLASFCLVCLVGSVAAAPQKTFGRAQLLFEKGTPHGTVRVVEIEESFQYRDEASGAPEEGGTGVPPVKNHGQDAHATQTVTEKTRWLLIDMAGHSAVIGEKKAPYFLYTYFMRQLAFIRPEGKEGLLVGLGAGTIAGDLGKCGVRMDVVEIEPVIEEMARRYFDFKPTGTVYIEDGRYFLRKCAKKYDFIVMDVFSGGAIPFHLFSIEALRTAKNCLKPDGIIAVNYLADTRGTKGPAASALLAMLKRLFVNKKGFVIASGKGGLQNLVVFASDGSLEVLDTQGDATLQSFLARVHKRMDECAVSCEVGEEVAPITDELNPLDTWQSYQWEEMRRFVLDYFFFLSSGSSAMPSMPRPERLTCAPKPTIKAPRTT